MRKGYWIITFRSVKDPAALAGYIELAGPVLTAAGAKYVALGLPAKAYEAGVLERTVVIEFESLTKAIEVYESAEYQQSVQALAGAAERDVRVIEAFA